MDIDGKVTWLMGPEYGRHPFGNAAFLVDPGGNILYADEHSRLMIRYTDGRIEPRGVDAAFDDIRLLAWGPDGDIYVLDGLLIKVIAPDHSVRTLDLIHSSAETEFRRGGGLDGVIIFDMIVDPQGHIFLADWGRQKVLRISSQGAVSQLYNDSEHYGPEGLAFRDGGLAVFESSRPRANQGIVPRLLLLGHNGEASIAYDYSE